MSSLGTWLEIGKFAVYLAVPAVVTYAVATDSSATLYKLMGFRSYVEYPPEGPRPLPPEELREMAREMARNKNTR